MDNDKEVEIWAVLKIVNENTKNEILIKSDVTTEMLCDTVIEDLFGRLYYKKINFSECKSEVIININIFGEHFPIMDINRVYLKLLSDINSELVYNIKFFRDDLQDKGTVRNR